ncbi:MAG: hypothetical protein KTR32_07440 [Granulosicoccus sp.]|nr:hypothetical protein [Granulosicoccus sp.]
MTSAALVSGEFETDRSLVEAELSRLLAERRFAGAPQMSAFLNYVVTQTLAGNAERIKAYSVGVDALGKPHSFDAQNDPSVRVLALRLRKTLSEIYASGNSAYAIVSIKVGTYVPEFFKVRPDEGNTDKAGLSVGDSQISAPGHSSFNNGFAEPVICETTSSAVVESANGVANTDPVALAMPSNVSSVEATDRKISAIAAVDNHIGAGIEKPG